jgi:hypothetical protein
VHDFKAIIQTNAIRNLPITLEDIETVEMVFGPDIGALKGKTVGTKTSSCGIQLHQDSKREN